MTFRTRLPLQALLTEDHPVSRLLALVFLKPAGCDAGVAGHGREATGRCLTNTYDIVIMDCQIPEMDGYKSTRLARDAQAGSSTRKPILALTASAMDSDRNRCIAAGMDGIPARPTSQKAIAEALRQWLSQSRNVTAGV